MYLLNKSLTSTEKVIISILTFNLVEPTRKGLREALGLTTQGVGHNLRSLEDKGFIQLVKTEGGKAKIEVINKGPDIE